MLAQVFINGLEGEVLTLDIMNSRSGRISSPLVIANSFAYFLENVQHNYQMRIRTLQTQYLMNMRYGKSSSVIFPTTKRVPVTPYQNMNMSRSRELRVPTENNGKIRGQWNHAVLGTTISFPAVFCPWWWRLVGRDEGNIEKRSIGVHKLSIAGQTSENTE